MGYTASQRISGGSTEGVVLTIVIDHGWSAGPFRTSYRHKIIVCLALSSKVLRSVSCISLSSTEHSP